MAIRKRVIDFIDTVFVFDPDPAACTVAAAAVREYFNIESVDADIVKFTDPQAIIRLFTKNRKKTSCFDLPSADGGIIHIIQIYAIFIGVDSEEDLETSRKIGELDQITPMFMMSRTEAYGIDAYRLKMLNLLIKPVTLDEVRDSLELVSREELIVAQEMYDKKG